MSILDKDSAMEDHWTDNPRFKKTTMTKEEALKIIKLLSAVESWSFSMKAALPDYLHEDLCLTVERLEKIVLEKNT